MVRKIRTRQIYGKIRKNFLNDDIIAKTILFDCEQISTGEGGENQLFGWAPGTYNDEGHKSPIAAAGKGTLILDEFGKVPVKYQDKFNALLNPNNRQYTSFGHSEKKAECHFIATMWEPLDEISKDIRSDLMTYYYNRFRRRQR